MSSGDADATHKKMCRKIYNSGVETAINLVNEPSVAMFRIQEHVRKTAPEIAEERKKAFICAEKLQGANYDLDNTLEVISTFPKVESNLLSLLKTLDACNTHLQNLVTSQQNREQDDFELGVDVVALLPDDV